MAISKLLMNIYLVYSQKLIFSKDIKITFTEYQLDLLRPLSSNSVQVWKLLKKKKNTFTKLCLGVFSYQKK